VVRVSLCLCLSVPVCLQNMPFVCVCLCVNLCAYGNTLMSLPGMLHDSVYLSVSMFSLQNMKAEYWGDLVTVVSSDMRHWSAPELADIIVSELLGSFGDNELSPECLDGAQHFLKGNSTNTIVWDCQIYADT